MTDVDQLRAFHEEEAPYTLPLPTDAMEWKRLDDMHEAMNVYFGHKLSDAPIPNDITQILEIGCGSGAWAIQAAQTYPHAIVTAVDLSPLPDRPIPDNIKFQKLDITQALPFPPASFDVVHARYLFLHLSNWENVLQRVSSLLKPGGWLLLEDIDHMLFQENGEVNVGPNIQEFYRIYYEVYTPSRGVDYIVGSRMEEILKKMNLFSEVNAVKIKCPFDGRSEDPRIRDLGLAMGEFFRRGYRALSPKFIACGITPEIHQGLFDELDDPERSVYNNLFVISSRKAA
ncbi:S-adenosyl-L-methionine-dependent methyltransferase [Lyophyllum atratum]|nr:S-adenosyl-L-methionine-dependent methyltransferase [Lyophyllum atratum]